MYNPTDREDCDETLFEVKKELDESAKGAKGAEGPKYETFCNPTKGHLNSEWIYDDLINSFWIELTFRPTLYKIGVFIEHYFV